VDLVGHLLVHVLREQLELLERLVLVDREALLLQRGLELLLVVPVRLLLDEVDAVLHLFVADLDAELLRPLGKLGSLEEIGERLPLERDVLLRTGLRKLLLVRLVALLRALHHRVEIVLRDVLAADDDHVAGAERPGAATAATGGENEHDDECEKGERCEVPHGKSATCSGLAHAAWRAASIASTSRSACEKPSSRRVISRLATV